MFSLKITKRPPTAERIVKNIRFGVAKGLTETAKEGVKAVQGAVKGRFTYRNNWLPASNRFGIRMKAAKPSTMSAEVRTNADWLRKQEQGGTISGSEDERIFHYRYRGRRYIAVPSRELRPKGSTRVINKALWPSSLRKKKSTFVILSKKNKTPIVMSRFAPGKNGYTPMYILKPDVKVDKVDTFVEPIKKVVSRRLGKNIANGIRHALATAK